MVMMGHKLCDVIHFLPGRFPSGREAIPVHGASLVVLARCAQPEA